MITAHSGCEGTGIDTMDSIEKALAYCADAVEIDIRIDPLGELRISHNPLSLEDYFKKNPLADVFDLVRPTSLLINFDIKERAALYKTLDAAQAFGFPTERLIFTGCTNPKQLLDDQDLSKRASFFLNLEEILKYIYQQRREEFNKELFSALIKDPYIIWIDEENAIPNIFLVESTKIPEKLYAVSKSIRGKVIEDTLRILQDTGAAAVNMQKFLLWTQIDEMLQSGNVPLSVWTVDDTKTMHHCLEENVYNITTHFIQSAQRIRSEYI